MKLGNISIIKSLLLTTAAVFTLSSCSLDDLPRDKQVAGSYPSPTDIEQGVLGAYSYLRNMSDVLYLHLSEVRSDNTWVEPMPNGSREYSEIGTFRVGYTSSTISSAWETLFKVIYAANTVLDNIDGVDFPADNDQVKLKDQLKGECLFLRGYAYFELARLFGRVPLMDRVYTPAEAKETPQASASEVYWERIIPDLIEAESLLPEPGVNHSLSFDNNGRANSIAAAAMLGRVYMQLAGFPLNDSSAEALAEVKIKQVLDYADRTGKFWANSLADWRRQFMMDGNNKYSIFALQYETGGFGNPAIFNFSPDIPATYYNRVNISNGIYIFGNSIWIEKTLQYLYTLNQNSTGDVDQRGFDWTVLNGYQSDGSSDFQLDYANQVESVDYGDGPVNVFTRSFFYKFLDSKPKREEFGLTYSPESGMVKYDDWPINHPVIRLEDMMLLYAEIQVNKGQITPALEIVNRIRQRAGADLVPLSATDTEAMDYIKRERRLELAGEGVRWFDQVRYGTWLEDTKEMFARYGYPDGISDENIKPGRHYYPIPQNQIDSFAGLYTQNEGY